MSKQMVYISLMVFFLLGLCLGITGTMAFGPNPPPMGRVHQPQDRESQAKHLALFEHLKVDLHLRPEQEENVLRVLEEDAKSMEPIFKKMQEHMQQLIEKLKPELDLKQRDDLDRIHSEMKNRMPPPPRMAPQAP